MSLMPEGGTLFSAAAYQPRRLAKALETVERLTGLLFKKKKIG